MKAWDGCWDSQRPCCSWRYRARAGAFAIHSRANGPGPPARVTEQRAPRSSDRAARSPWRVGRGCDCVGLGGFRIRWRNLVGRHWRKVPPRLARRALGRRNGREMIDVMTGWRVNFNGLGLGLDERQRSARASDDIASESPESAAANHETPEPRAKPGEAGCYELPMHPMRPFLPEESRRQSPHPTTSNHARLLVPHSSAKKP